MHILQLKNTIDERK
jgi:hypothetical protein